MKSSSQFPEDLDSNLSMGLERLIALSDGIFAFSMTLLAVNVNFPHLPADVSPADVNAAVVGLVPQILIYMSSFLFVALYWQAHRRNFHFIQRNDSLLTWLNLLQLMCVAFLPAATGLFDSYGSVPSVILLYTGTLAIIGILGEWWWRHARVAGLIDANANPILLDYYTFRGRITILVFLLTIAIGMVVPMYARGVLIFFLVVYPFLARIYRFQWHRRRKEQA